MSFPQYYKILGISETATPDQIRQAYKRESLKTHPDRLPKGHTPAEKKRATEKFQAVADANYVLSDPVRRRDYDNLARQRGGFGAGSSSSKAGGFGGGYQQQQQQQSSSSQAPPGAFPEFNFAEFMNNMNNARKSRRAQQTAEEEEEEEDEEDEYEQDNADKASGNFFKTFAGMFGMGGGGAGEKDKTDGGRPDANKMFGDVFEDMLAPEVAHVRPFYSWVGGGAGAGLGFIIGNVPGAVAGAALGNRLGAIRDAKGKSVAQVFTTLDAGAKAEILKVLAMKVLGSLGS